MRYYLSRSAALKQLETPSVYQIARDELYELDGESFRFLNTCASENGCTGGDDDFLDYCIEEGILTTEPVAVRRPPIAPSPAPSLRYLELQITDRCNLRCRHCYIGDGTARELPFPQVKTVLEEFERMQGLRVLLTGGEPLLHSRFDAINELLPDLALRSVLFTNGIGLSPAFLARLKVQEIQVSIDGREAGHDLLRGNGTWQRSMEALRRARDAGFPVSVSTMVHAGNLNDFEAMEKLFRSLGVKEWTVDVPCPTGRLQEHRDLLVSPEIGGTYLGYGFGGGMHASAPGHGCGLHLMAVLPDGTAAKCTFYGDRPAGSIRDGIRACWDRIRPVRLSDLSCACQFVEACRGGCRYRAESLEGPGGRDPYRCALYGLLDRPK
jgi:radical SAM protein with 4Fe4S-binding SPASM domain